MKTNFFHPVNYEYTPAGDIYNLVGFFFSLRSNRANLACAVIRDTVSDHLLVISACGVTSSGISDNIVEQWDLTTWDTDVLPYTCPPGVEYFDSGTYYIQSRHSGPENRKKSRQLVKN